MKITSGNEWVHRAKCSICGSSGPMSASTEGAVTLAILCGWDELSRCMNCIRLVGEKKAKEPKKVEAKKHSRPASKVAAHRR